MALNRREFVAASLAALAAAQPAPAATKAAPADGGRHFRRGGAIHTMMNWGALREDDPTRYKPRPFEAPRNVFPAALVDDFAASGFDYIRFSIDVGPFMQLRGTDLEALEDKLVHNIGLLHARGLDVIVDCHPVTQVPAYSVFAVLEDLDGPAFAAYTEMITRLAGLLSGVKSGRVALELMNEPQLRKARHSTQIRVWAAAQLVLHDAARRAAPDLPLVLTGGHHGGIQGLVDLDPRPYLDSDAQFSFHYYSPLAFTHQGIRNYDPDYAFAPYVVGLPYPADLLQREELVADITRRISSDPKLDAAGRVQATRHASRILEHFIADSWNRERVEDDMARVERWAARYGVAHRRVVLGECGVTRRGPGFTGADPASRRRWLSDVTAAVESRGFGWALWEINGPQFGIFSRTDEDRVDPNVLQAVGLSG